MTNLLTFVSVFLLSWLGVGLFRKWSARRSILDVPNERSSHEIATPVGGGLVIVVMTLLPLLAYEILVGEGLRYWGFYAGALIIATVSWFDDIRHVSPFLRFAVHIACAVIAVLQIGSFSVITVWPESTLSLGVMGPLLTVVWVVWMTNAYNFMDGIDGIAGTQAVVASAGWALVTAYYGSGLLFFASLVVMAASLGFLIHNWPPAKVFMGDVGSAFLGYFFAVYPLIALSSGEFALSKGLIPVAAVGFVWLFFSDTIVTLFRRAISGEKLWNAHRKHMYQELIKSGHSHLRVTLFYGVMMLLVAAATLAEVYTGVFGLTASACVIVLVAVLTLVIKNKKVDESAAN